MAIAAGIFRQYDIRGIVGEDLTDEAARALGGAYAALHARARRHGRGRRRPRQPAERRDAARCARRRAHDRRRRRRSTSASCRRRCSTGALHHLAVVGGIQITGSHNPPEYNGFKLCARHGVDARRRHPASLRAHRSANAAPTRQGHRAHEERHRSLRRRHRRSASARSRARSRSSYDCGNGAGALVAPQLFARARRRRARGLFCESDGTFPNHHPDPTVPENLEDLDRAR